MRKLMFFAVAALLTATSCNPWQKDIDDANHRADSIQAIQRQDSILLDQYFDIITEVQSNFKQIKEVELGIISETDGQEGVNSESRASIQENFKLISSNIQQNKEKIADLEAKLNASNSQLSGLRGTINKLKKQLAESQQELADLKTQLEAKDIKIADLETKMTVAAQQIDSVNSVSAQQQAAIAAQDAELNAVYYIVGTKAELKQKGLIEKMLKKGNDMSMNGFTKVDKRDFDELQTSAKKLPIFITVHPIGSYTFELQEDKTFKLKIKDYNKFWSRQKYAILQVK